MSKPGMSLLIIFALLIFGVYGYAEDSCIDCHSNPGKMKELGYPQFILTSEDVRAQSRMPASCVSCHMGNPLAVTKEEAHIGLLTVTAVGAEWNATARNKMDPEELKDWPVLQPRGENRATQLSPKRLSAKGEIKDNYDYKLIMWHDKNLSTLAFNPVLADQTCGTCHADIVKSFLKSAMGGAAGAHTQSQYVTWTGPNGPQSCGLWTGPLSKPYQDKFTDENIKVFNEHYMLPLSEKAAHNLQRTCNQCHTGCLDCHFNPQKQEPGSPGKGLHSFSKKPVSLSCYGGGRSFSCHAGPMERRRGDGYFRAEFAQATPKGKETLAGKTDVHMRNNIECVDCHESNRETGSHGDLRRDVDCSKCHNKTVAAYKKGPHRKVDCAACHTALIGGYAFNFWTAIGERGKENPLTRIQDYYTDAIPPVLVKNRKGNWIPVHVVPHTSGNVKAEGVKFSKRLMFRNRPDAKINRGYVSNDSYAITGLVKNLDDNDHDTMVWLNVDRVAHGTGRSRTCESCHSSTSQKVTTGFGSGSYKDIEDGQYTIVADEKGLRVVDFKGPDRGPMPKGLGPFSDKWNLNGNFALPAIKNRVFYEKLKGDYEKGKFIH